MILKLKIITILIIVTSFFSCKRDEPVVPEIPPISSLYTNFENFAAFNYTKAENLLYASELLSNWKNVIDDSLSLIMSSYEADINEIPEYQSNNTWLWENSVEIDTTSYSSKLFNVSENDSSYWKLYATKESNYNNLIILDGYFNSKLTSGDWILKRIGSDTLSENYYSISWSKDSLGQEKIKYTNILSGSVNNGKYLLKVDSIDNSYDSYFVLYNKAKDTYTYIQTNKQTKVGRIKSIDHFGVDTWQCWDENGNDITCP